MAPSTIKRAIWTIKDHTSISLALVGGSNPISNLEVAIVKATRHEENPPNQRYISEIASLTSYSHTLVHACVTIIAQRLNKTKNWVVALKTLMLVQRLLSQGGQAFEMEIFFAKRRRMKFLNMCDFRDTSSKSNAWDYSAFVRMYALYLDEQLEFRMQGTRGRNRAGGEAAASATSNAMVVKATPMSEMKNVAVFSRVRYLIKLLDRFLACRPTGAAKHNRVVIGALHPIVKESFQLFHNVTEVLGILVDRFMQLDIPDMIQVYEIFYLISKQYDELDSFYDWCKGVGIMRFSEYPDIKKIPPSKLEMMDDFIHQKSDMLNNRTRASSDEPKPMFVEEARKLEPEKALPPPEGSVESTKNRKEKTEIAAEVGELLDLSENALAAEEHGDQDNFALALFDGIDLSTTAPTSTATPWEAFKNSSGDWEMALVQSASQFSNQMLSLPKGFDTFTLDSLYEVDSSGLTGTGSSSSVALGSARGPDVLALPAPPADNGEADSFSSNTDPFAAALATVPPLYVQMPELEKKQRLLAEEQLMWQQYARDRIQGHVGLPNVQQPNSHQYIPAGYTPTW